MILLEKKFLTHPKSFSLTCPPLAEREGLIGSDNKYF
jgi:hypothetical protein